MTADGGTAGTGGIDGWTGVLHRGLGWVGRWPGLVAVIPNDPAHDMAAEQLLRLLGAGSTAEEARQTISAAALRGELRAAAYVAQPGDPSTLVGFACGVTEVIADGQVLLNGTSPLQELALGTPQQVTVRAANLAAAARAVSPFDLRQGIVPGAGITMAPMGATFTTDQSIAGTGSALAGGAVRPGGVAPPAGPGAAGPPPGSQPLPPSSLPGGPPPVAPPPIPVAGGAGVEAQRRPEPPTGLSTPAPPEVGPFVAVLLNAPPASPPAPLAPLPTLRPTAEPAPPAGPLGHPAPSHRISGPELPIADDDVVVEGILCSRHHFNNPIASYCMVCGISMVHLTHNLVPGPRPTLGFVVFDNGSTYGLDRSYVVGREPGHVAESNMAPLAIHDDNETLSRRHAEIRLVGWDVHIVDLGSTNGTFVWDVSFERWNQIAPNMAVLLSPGDTVALGRRTFVFESVTRL